MRNTILLLVLAGLLAGCGQSRQGERLADLDPDDPPADSVTVLVASRDLAEGTVITMPQQLAMKRYSKSSVPAGHFPVVRGNADSQWNALQEIHGRALKVPAARGEPILQSQLTETAEEDVQQPDREATSLPAPDGTGNEASHP